MFCMSSGLPVLKHVLTPRSKAFRLCVDHLRGRCDAVYDVTMAYSSTRSENTPGVITRGAAPALGSKFCFLLNSSYLINRFSL